MELWSVPFKDEETQGLRDELFPKVSWPPGNRSRLQTHGSYQCTVSCVPPAAGIFSAEVERKRKETVWGNCFAITRCTYSFLLKPPVRHCARHWEQSQQYPSCRPWVPRLTGCIECSMVVYFVNFKAQPTHHIWEVFLASLQSTA